MTVIKFGVGGFTSPSFNLSFLESFENGDIHSFVDILKSIDFPATPIKLSEFNKVIKNVFPNIEDSNIKSFYSIMRLTLGISDDYEEFKAMVTDQISSDDDIGEKDNTLEKFKLIVDLLEEKIISYYKRNIIDKYKFKGCFRLQELSAACNLRGRFKNEFDSEVDDIETYKPEFHDWIPKISLSFTIRNENTTRSFSFEIDETDYDNMIRDLLIAQKELKALKKSVKRV